MNTPHQMSRMSDDTPRSWQAHASSDASRVSTRRGEWVPLMTRLILADLEVDLELARLLPLGTRAEAAVELVDNAARRLQAIGIVR